MHINGLSDKLVWLKNLIFANMSGLILSICGGILLEIPTFIWMFDPYMSFSPNLSEDAETRILMLISVLFAIIVPVVSIVYRGNALCRTIGRAIIMLSSSFLTAKVTGYLMIIPKLYNVLEIVPSQSTDNAISVFLGMYLVAILFNSFIVIVVNAVARRLAKHFQ